MKYIIVLLFFILLPQIFYAFKYKNYKDLKNGSRFFIKEEKNLKDRKKIILTNSDGFDLYVNLFDLEKPKAVVQIIHGMLEHSLNYLEFAKYLNDKGYAVVIADNRGHGKSISENHPSGFIRDYHELIDDQVIVNKYIRMLHKDKKIYMLGHSMGSLIARNYLKENDQTIDKLVLTGTVSYIPIASIGVFLGNIISFYLGEKRRSKLLDKLSGITSKDSSWISYNKENIRIKENDPMRLNGFLAKSNVSLFSLVKGLNEKKKYKLRNKKLQILSLNGIDDDVTGGEEGIKRSLGILKSLGYENIDYKIYDKMKHEVLNEENNIDVFDDINKFFNIE
ncbi:alpha/beta hydrolase [Anaerococcus sp. AGMB00486]|uniref:Alpha/beta hydrolase n=2 Tax=Anaerococcus TaxID=165779 RepID=A0ABX2NBA9_9FIRM|nr:MULTISPECIES: alpha/beta hydrolase [Anaerococcus]MSS78249.1 alpha/beta hydrolase [Anaerococcus porci]NVF12007.1 alpha/beta hydrolase [Anaerococcus faecalis]